MGLKIALEEKILKIYNTLSGFISGLNWVQFPEAALNDLFFFKNLLYQNNCKEAMNIRGGKIGGALFNCFIVKSALFCTFWMLPSLSKITPAYNALSPTPFVKHTQKSWICLFKIKFCSLNIFTMLYCFQIFSC